MDNSIQSIVEALELLKEENPESSAIRPLERALKSSMKHYVLDMAAMGSVIDIEEIEKQLESGMRLLKVMSPGGGQEGNG